MGMSFSRRARVVQLAFLLLSSISAKAAPVQAKHAQVELAAKQSGIAPRSTVLVGAHFTPESGWHVYWKNPGDSGQPPVLQWNLPQGFSAGDTEWPTPERLQASPELADY